MKLNGIITRISSVIAATAFLIFAAGCEDDGTAGKDYGDNDPNIVACMGDSLTMGYMCEGASYPERLAALTGKTILDYGVGGVQSSYGVSIVSSVVARKPAYVCILYGTNDAINRNDPEETKTNLLRVINICRGNSNIPILATIPPQNGLHAGFNNHVSRIAEAIRELAHEEGVCLVDLNKAFGDGEKYLNPDDGLHLSDAGGELVAKKFAKKIP
ncbi:MAG: GDSL-type esterase/lipase family protein [Kiritimatiellaeota bacterium]|nr:GDSL-type esterase/lipase family protein [Kiritimatiellota bacterium]